MREIKFRAWNGSKMLYNIGLHPFMIFRLSDNGLCEEDEYDDNSGNLVVTNSAYNVMQYTGLKDKIGVEIYEGDIIKFIGGTCDFLSLHHYGKIHNIGTILVVQKLLSGFTLQLPYHIGKDIPNLVGNINNYDFWNHQKSFKVIGNIHQNTELL